MQFTVEAKLILGNFVIIDHIQKKAIVWVKNAHFNRMFHPRRDKTVLIGLGIPLFMES